MSDTLSEYDSIIAICRDIYTKKFRDYGSAWRVLRTSSLTDQIFIKAKRIRSIEEKGTSKVNEGVISEYIGIANYAVMALIQLEKGASTDIELPEEEAFALYDNYFKAARDLMTNKNHDYDEAWREMRLSSITDLILQKILRIKQIENNQGKTEISEGLDANFLDMINYAVFALIRLH